MNFKNSYGDKNSKASKRDSRSEVTIDDIDTVLPLRDESDGAPESRERRARGHGTDRIGVDAETGHPVSEDD